MQNKCWARKIFIIELSHPRRTKRLVAMFIHFRLIYSSIQKGKCHSARHATTHQNTPPATLTFTPLHAVPKLSFDEMTLISFHLVTWLSVFSPNSKNRVFGYITSQIFSWRQSALCRNLIRDGVNVFVLFRFWRFYIIIIHPCFVVLELGNTPQGMKTFYQ